MSGIVKFVGSSVNKKTLEKLDEIDKFDARQAWFNVGRDFIKTIRDEVRNQPKTGRVYFVKKRKNGRRFRHKASAPGESHANITGRTLRSAGWKVRSNDLRVGYGLTSPKATDHANYLENGTKDKNGNVKMQPRPSIQNSIDRNEKNTEEYLELEIERQHKK